MADRYWVGGTASWDGTAGTKWATTSGGAGGASVPTSDDDVFFDVNSTGTVTIAFGNTDAKSLNCAGFSGTMLGASSIYIYGSVTFSSGMTLTWTSGNMVIAGTGVIVTAGKLLPQIVIEGEGAVVTLGDNLNASSLYLKRGTFDAVTYNVTVETVLAFNTVYNRTLKMGSGLWNVTGSGTCWYLANTNLNFYKNSANILLSNNTTSSRVFVGANFSYNKLTIGGASASSTLTIQDSNTFAEIDSTKTVAHVINFDAYQTFGKWSVSGSLGNIVSLTGVGGHSIAGSAVSGVDYLNMGSVGLSSGSPAEFYAGANSTGTAGAPVFRTAAPSPRTLYWVGGTGNWSNTSRWSTSSGGPGGAPIPTSLDDVVFDANSGPASYTLTINTTSRCNKLTLYSGVALAGSGPYLILHGDFTLPVSAGAITYNGYIVLSGSTSGKTISTNVRQFDSEIFVDGINCGWSLGSGLYTKRALYVRRGAISCGANSLTCTDLVSEYIGSRSIDFGSAITTLSGGRLLFGDSENSAADLTVVSGTSQIYLSGAYFGTTSTFRGNGKTFYQVIVTSAAGGSLDISGANAFYNLIFESHSSTIVRAVSIFANQIVSGTLLCQAGSNATARRLIASDQIGQARTITCSAASIADVDFRDIFVDGAASPISGSRIGDCKGNVGIIFTPPANKYWNLPAGGEWYSNAWATSSGGVPALNNFPLAQDTCIFESVGLNSGATVNVQTGYQVGSIDMSGRTSNTMTLRTVGTSDLFVYGNWTNGSGSTVAEFFAGYGISFAGRSVQQITSAGKTFPQIIKVAAPYTYVVLQDNFSGKQISLTSSDVTIDANGNDVLLSGSFTATSSAPKTIAVGSGAWSIGSSWSVVDQCFVSGDGVIKMTSSSPKTFAGGGVFYGDVSIEQAGVGQLSITGDNKFKNMRSSVLVANTISMSGTTQYILGSWTARGYAGNLLTVSGGSLVKMDAGIAANVDYLNIVGNSAYPSNSWYAGPSSTGTSSFGWLFVNAPSSANFFMFL